MPTYIDTSALLRLVDRRGDYSLVEAGLKDGPISSDLTELECWVSIHKRWHDGQVSLGDRDGLLEVVAQEALRPTALLRIDGDVLAEARSVAIRFPLRSADAIHVATAVLADRRLRPAGLAPPLLHGRPTTVGGCSGALGHLGSGPCPALALNDVASRGWRRIRS